MVSEMMKIISNLNLAITGKNIEVRQVGLEKDRLDPADVFVLDQGVSIFVWQGPEANFSEKHKVRGLIIWLEDPLAKQTSEIFSYISS